jgi:hypothetical protein
MQLPSFLHSPGFQSGAVGDSVQPIRNHLSWPDRGCFAGKDKKGCLERIFGVVVIADDSKADSEHHLPVPADERLKSCFVFSINEGSQQVAVGFLRSIRRESRSAEMSNQGVYG